jgi:ATP-binding cassette subfamily B protein
MTHRRSIIEKIKTALRVDRALRFVWQAGPHRAVINLVLICVQGVLPLLALYLMKLIVDAVTVSVSASDKSDVFRHVLLLIGLAALVALFNALLQTVAGLVKEGQTLAVTDYMYTILHTQSVAMDLAYYDNPRYFDTLHRAQKEGPYRPNRIVDALVRLGRSAVSLLAMAGLLFAFHWGFALILFAAALPGVLVRITYSGKMFHWQRHRTALERKTTYFNWLLTGDEYAKEIRLFGLGDLFIGRFSKLRGKLRQEKFDIYRQRSHADLVAQVCATLAVFGSFGFIAHQAILGTITLGGMVMYFQAFQRGLGYLRDLLGSLADLYENNLFLSNLYEFLDLTPEIKGPDHPKIVPETVKSGIAVQKVGFRYPSARAPVLVDISLSIAPGEVIALVGENGSGKTTLVKLLCRLYDPKSGVITLDGIDLRRFDPAAYRRQISVVFQDFVKYHLTAQENIGLGNIDAAVDQQQVQASAEKAGVHDLITSLPNGYDTILGRRFEKGEELSIGEWQKIALARAFMRPSRFIVLDEPTSSLDAKTEYEVFKHFRKLLEGRTAVLISHRFSTVRMADRILVMEKGKITENGSHEDLMALDGTYARMYNQQAEWYR